jgi:UDP-N-acetylglucosamine pyrophosphorylase
LGVDNLLARPCDPVLQGMLEDNLDMVIKYIRSYPEESTGRIIFSNNALSIIEYSELKQHERSQFTEVILLQYESLF